MKAIIGAGLGDEGKGLITDLFSSQHKHKCLVVRFNGGGQAAHTVVTPEGDTHIFHHIGSGTFNRSATYLSEYFIINPMVFVKEYMDLVGKGYKPRVYASPDAIVSTPFDMFINQQVEAIRKEDKHGSCGIGINETVTRSEEPEHRIVVSDLYDAPELRKKLESIRDEWMPRRFRVLGYDHYIPSKDKDAEAIDGFMRLARTFITTVDVFDIEEVVSCFDDIVFEGAQGLLLDEHHSWFPNVTRSRTGIVNVIHLANRCGIDSITPVFVTRCYATRHGAGPLLHETPEPPYENISDPTNIFNPHQGNLRFGHLDISLLKETIRAEIDSPNELFDNPVIAVTCLDQVDDVLTYYLNDVSVKSTVPPFLNLMEQEVGLEVKYRSYGRSRSTIKI